MRKIKFRAWNIPNKTMYYDVQNGVLAENEKGQLVLGVSLGTLCKDDGSIVMQFTGLHDKNGKEIYEGDILEDTLGRKKLVEYYKDGFWLNAFLEGAEWSLRRENSSSKVIGNSFENPELLTD